MVESWVGIEVVEGPEELKGKIAKFRISAVHITDEGPWAGEHHYTNCWGTLGRVEFMQMFGDFAGLEKISRNHIKIEETGLIYIDDQYQRKLIVEDVGSTNGTTFPSGDSGDEVLAVLGSVLTIKISLLDEKFTGVGNIVSAHRVSEGGYSPKKPLDDDSLMDLITSEVKKLCLEMGMAWQIRRKWDVREKPVDQSTISDYEWKIIPIVEPNGSTFSPGENVSEDFVEGSYYLLFVKESQIFLEHSGRHVGIYHPSTTCSHYVVQDLMWIHEYQEFYLRHDQDLPFEISKWLKEWIETYPPSFYSIT